MKKIKFSIITPVTYDRGDADEKRMPRYMMFQRCIKSVLAQTYDNFEWIIADDKCNPPVRENKYIQLLTDVLKKATVIDLPEKSGRIIATNRALEQAKGDWICFLDADDEYATIYLEALADAIRLNPDVKVFNFNHLIFEYNYRTWVRKFINMDIQGYIPFPSGVIGTGSFIFHKTVLKDIGLFYEGGLWDFANKMFEDYPEIKPYFEKTDQPGQYNSLGNPWGTDYNLFYRITRKYKSKYLDTALYYVHSRWGHRWPDDPNYVVDPGKAPENNPNNV